MVNFIRFQLQTRSLLKQLFTTEKIKSAKYLKSHFDSDPSNASDESGNIDPDPFDSEEPREFKSADAVKPTTNQLERQTTRQLERSQIESIVLHQDDRAGAKICKQLQTKKDVLT